MAESIVERLREMAPEFDWSIRPTEFNTLVRASRGGCSFETTWRWPYDYAETVARIRELAAKGQRMAEKDIVERLRQAADDICERYFAEQFLEAADEIERLRGDLDLLHDVQQMISEEAARLVSQIARG
jgi:hypothetical protein